MKQLILWKTLLLLVGNVSAPAADFAQIYEQAKQLEAQANPIFAVPSERLGTNELLFIAEIHAGSTEKNELRTATGQVIMDRDLCPRPVLGSSSGQTVAAFPAHYGIAPGRFSFDGDPLDLVVFGSDPVYERMVASGDLVARKIRVIGVMQMEECGDVPCKKDWENDWKVLGVDLQDPRYGKMKTFSDLGDADRQALDLFFSNYKGPEKGHPQTRVKGFLEADDALSYIGKFPPADPNERKKEVAACRAHNARVLARLVSQQDADQPKLDREFMKCLPRVFDARFFQDQKTFKAFQAYSAYQIMKKTGKGSKRMTLGTALSEVQKRRDKKKTHYRFVYRDAATPGTEVASAGSGDVILEWVKTKNRNQGCPSGFKPQHYDVQPLSGI